MMSHSMTENQEEDSEPPSPVSTFLPAGFQPIITPRPPSFYLLAGLARIALIQGQFDRTRVLAGQLLKFAAQYDDDSVRALGLAFQGLLAVLVDEDHHAAEQSFAESRTASTSPQTEGLILRGLTLITAVQHPPEAAAHFTAALRAALHGYGMVDVLLAALLELPANPVQCIQWLSLGWHYALPDGGWLTHSPLFRRIAQSLQQQCGDEAYDQHWQAGEHLPLRSTLDAIARRYTR